MTDWKKPSKFDANLIVLGAGSAGLIAAYISAALQARVILIEENKMGGDCLNTGCVPSKTLLGIAKTMHEVRHANKKGIQASVSQLDFGLVRDQVKKAIATIEPNDSMERYRGLGVECIAGSGRVVDPWTVEVNNQRYRARNLVIATGANPQVPPIDGLSQVDYLTTETVWDMKELPKRLCILGGGAIGCELAQAFQRLGSTITIVEMADRLLFREDPEISELMTNVLSCESVQLKTGNRAVRVTPGRLICQKDGGEFNVEFDQLLVATGRRPRVNGLGLEDIGLQIDPSGQLQTNGFLQTNFSHIYACGDVAGPFQFTHAAGHQGWYAAMNALFRPIKQFRVDYSHFPWCIYTDPEIGGVGLSETEVTKRGISFQSTHFELAELDRAIADQSQKGFIRVLTLKNTDKILGATVAGPRAGELVSLLALAIRNKIGLNAVLSTVMPYPTHAELVKRVAGSWKKNQIPQWVLPWLKRYHHWRR